MTEVASAFVSLLPSARRFGTLLDGQIGGDVARSGRKAGGLFGGAFGKVTSRLGPLIGVGAVAAFAKKAVDLEATFSQTMNQMAAVANVPQGQIKTLSKLAIQMGKDTVFSASDAADAMLELAKNGISPAVIQAGALKSALTLAAAGGVSMEEAATTMGNALNAFGLKGKDAASVAAALAGAANASSASIPSLSQGLAQAATGAHQAGLSIQETTAALAAFANAGIQGSDAGTSLKTFLQRLVPQTDKAEKAMEAYGLSTYNAHAAAAQFAQDSRLSKPMDWSEEEVDKSLTKMFIKEGDATAGQKMKLAKMVQDYKASSGILDSKFLDNKGNFEGLATISGALNKSLSKLSQSQRQTALNTIFGSDASRAAAILMNQGTKGIEKNIKATSDQGAAQRVAASRMKGTAGAIEQFKGSLETVTLQFGQFISPYVQKGLNFLTSILNKLPGIFTTIGNAIHPVTAATKSIGGMGHQLEALDAVSGGSKFAAFIAPIVVALKNMGPAFSKTGAALLKFGKALLPTLREFGTKLMATVGPGLSEIAKLVTTQLLPAFDKVLPILLPVAKFLLGMFGDAVIGLIKGFFQALKGVIQIITGVFKLVTALVHGDWSGAWAAVVQIAKGAFNLVIGAIKVWFNFGILSVFKSGVLRLLGSWRLLWDGLKGLGTRGLAALRGVAERGLTSLGRGFGAGVKAIGRIIWAGIKGYAGLYKRLFNLLWTVVRNGWSVLRSAFGGALRAIRTIVADLAGRLPGFFRVTFIRLKSIVKDGISKVVSFFKSLPGRIVTALGNVRSTLLGAGKNIVRGMIDGIGKMGAKLAKFVKKFVLDHIPAPIAKALGMQSPSRLMADQAQYIPLGMVKGIDANAHHVDKAMGRLANRVQVAAPSLDPSVVAATTSSSAPARGGLGGPLFHVDKVEAQDVNHFLREMNSRGRAVSGGGVAF